MLRNAKLTDLLLAVLVLISPFADRTLVAETCEHITVNLPEAKSGKVPETLHLISILLQRSLLAEIRSPSEHQNQISLTAGQHSMSEIAQLVSGSGPWQCEVAGGVIHIFDPTLIAGPENALNHVFRGFSVSSDPRIFALELRERLYHEAFDPLQADSPNGPGGGAVSPVAPTASLRPEVLQDITARKLFLNEASQARICLVVEIPTTPRSPQPSRWVEIDQQLHIYVIS